MNKKPTPKEKWDQREMDEWWEGWTFCRMKKAEVFGLVVLDHMLDNKEFREIVRKQVDGPSKIRRR